MASSRHAGQSLNYFQQSPVRGQLEVPDGYSRSGWRYLQCTDTPNELRVLLPPRTAQIYGNLLRAELVELAKDRNASWDRILQIRHLKDRMIRKCTRLARASAPVPAGKQSSRSMFFTVHAPPDFRLKEMERWFRMQGAEIPQDAGAPGTSSSSPYCCSKCNPAGAQASTSQTPHRRATSVSHHGASQMSRRGTVSHPEVSQPVRRGTAAPPRHSSVRRSPERVPLRRGDSSSQATTLLNPSPPPLDGKPAHAHKQQLLNAFNKAGRVPSVMREADAQLRVRSVERKRSAASDASAISHAARLKAKSPDPLPIPFRTHDPDAAPPTDSPSTLLDELPEPEPMFTASPEPMASPPNGQMLPTIHEGSERGEGDGDEAHRPLPRRRSSLKKCGSISRLSIASNTKSVAWAMDRDWIEQMSNYMKTANEAEVLGHELDGLRVGYQQEVETMKSLCSNVRDASERIRQEMEKLQRDEELVRKQEDRLLHTIEQLEQKENHFRDKVMSVLEETKRVVNLCDKKRELNEL